jgi:alcohol dehydrogenase class IV
MLENFYNTATEKGFYSPVRLMAGENSRNKIPDLVRGKGPVVVVTDVLFTDDPLVEALAPVRRIIVSAEPNETTLLATALEIPKDTAWIVAIGGGSAMDTAKAIAAYLRFGKLRIRDESAQSGAPHLIAVPTTAGSGSETSRFFIMHENETGLKTSVRSWAIAPELAVLDPYFLCNAPSPMLILGAFDAFMHLWETFVCRNERSPISDAFCLTGMPQILKRIKKLQTGSLNAEDFMQLQLAASMGGVAISNVRTGMAHTMGESLAAQVNISHPASLYVFFSNVMRSYAHVIQDRVALLDAATQTMAPEFGAVTIESICSFWYSIFEAADLANDIENTIVTQGVSVTHLVKTIARDSVLQKENPTEFTDADILLIVEMALKRFDGDRNMTQSATA